ncbi:MAG: DUF5103 domain-containing protein [Flavobacterium sp.]|jgi:hypothetical protein
MQKFLITLLSIVFNFISYSQIENEVQPPFNIKTVAFTQNSNNITPFVKLGESFALEFDDLYGNEADYYYTITLYNYDWTESTLVKSEYLTGMDNQRIMTYENSFNTLQQYSHYTQVFPNKFNRITKSGNYIFKILNDEQEIVFSKKIIIYEDIVGASLLVKRARDFESLYEKQNLELTINYGERILQNPIQNIKVSFFQNGNWNTAIHNIKPQYTLGTELIYRYNQETQFWAGNEFYTLDNSNIRNNNNSVSKVTAGDIYNSHLYINYARQNKQYTYFPDFNGNFYSVNINSENPQTEADYAWVYFTLEAPSYFLDKNIYINGMFNNYVLSDEFKLNYNSKTGLFEKAILLKQGYINYQYVIADSKKNIDYKNAIDGNFYQTENNYVAIIYYRGNNDRTDHVIGITKSNSETIRN